MKKHNKKSGFTLVELAIVLVIIGLIVGGVLAGQDLIKAAELRAAVGQIEKLDTVVNAFRGKYNAIPGDVPNPGNFGFVAPSVTTTAGNGVLDPTTGVLTQENAAFFEHLARAGLINENIAPSAAELIAAGIITSMSHYAPISKLGKGIYVWAQSSAGTNYYMFDNDDGSTLAATGVITPSLSAMSRIVAYNMDTKLDDGVPTTGKVMAVDNVAGATALSIGNTAADLCVDNTPTPNVYLTDTPTNADEPKCALRIKASF